MAGLERAAKPILRELAMRLGHCGTDTKKGYALHIYDRVPAARHSAAWGSVGFGRVFLLHPSGFGACFDQVLSTPSGVRLLCVLPPVACILFAKVVAENAQLRAQLVELRSTILRLQNTLGGGGQDGSVQKQDWKSVILSIIAIRGAVLRLSLFAMVFGMSLLHSRF